MMLARVRPLALSTASMLTPNRVAIEVTVSPRAIVYVLLMTGAGALVGGVDGGLAGVTFETGVIAIDDPESVIVWPG